MKNKLVGVLVATIIVIVACCNIYTSKDGINLSDLVLNNVEALADYGETTPYDCYMAHCCYDPSCDCFGYSDRLH